MQSKRRVLILLGVIVALVVILIRVVILQDDVIIHPGGSGYTWTVKGNSSAGVAGTLRDDIFNRRDLFRLCQDVFLGFGRKMERLELKMTDGTMVAISQEENAGTPVLAVQIDDRSNTQDPLLNKCVHDSNDCQGSGIPEELYRDIEEYRTSDDARWKPWDKNSAPSLRLEHGSCFWPG